MIRKKFLSYQGNIFMIIKMLISFYIQFHLLYSLFS